ncbi:SIR2 family protein [Aliivibrio sifiae]|uniref:NAD(+) hydrolase ThsA n=1 Tax=Aliivibrio sifiae TaxID=566293 RepID=A0A2S7X2S5_9GAMM|nr:SIR2 family protein [Aliivibrio sifiae]PQJ84493.1 hypothetical protein BTO22_13275 [Aliivibrio sifiae]
MDLVRESFIRDIGKELLEENVAVFAGAGMSAGSGFVNWAELLRPIAEELGLDVDKESDLVSLAQYHCNANGNNRSQLNQRLIEEFSQDAKLTENHEILCRLPIKTFWTTNYDKLLEKALSSSGKVADVKFTKDQLSTTKPRRDAVIYKMHGDVEHPHDAVLTKDDYERYHVKMEQYLSALKGDLISKIFIFIGFSFTDPNLDYILSRVRIAYDGSQRRHYCFIKKISLESGEEEVDFKYRERKQELFVNDLNRFNVKAILIDDYSEITELLRVVEFNYKKKTIFISGAAHEYGAYGEKDTLEFVHRLSGKLIAEGYKIVSGFGLGIGSAVISGALEQIYMRGNNTINDQLILRPFPQSSNSRVPLKEVWSHYRKDMISHAGISIFLFGNKVNDGDIVNSNGMQEEYDISKSKGVLVIPVGATGYMAEELWSKEIENPPSKFSKLISDLNDKTDTLNQLEHKILEIIKVKINQGEV